MMTATLNLNHSLHNPLNLRYTQDAAWLGLDTHEPSRHGLCHFISESYGLRAALLLLQSCIGHGSLRTPASVAALWRRDADSQPHYLKRLCQLANLCPDTVLSNPNHLDRLVAAMAALESGLNLTPQQVAQARRRFGI